MRVLFSHSWFGRFDAKQWKASQPYPPYGTILAASLLRENGHRVELFDAQFAEGAGDVIPYFERFSPDVFVIFDDGFNYLTKMCLTNMREAAFEMQKIAKRFSCRVVVCSSDASDHFEKYLDHGSDVVIRGEAEFPLLKLVNNWKNGVDASDVPGAVFREGGKTTTSAKSEVMKDLDAFPMPAWDLIDIERYRTVWIAKHGMFSLNLATTRGCPFKCNWCAKPIYGNRYNSRSPEKVAEELEFLEKNYRPDHIWFADDIFGLKPGWVNRFAHLVRSKNIRVPFKIQSRADLLVQENYVQDLSDAGCETVWMGAESGSQKVLDAMDKGTTIDQIREATALLKKHHIHPAFFLQFGYPGETREDIDSTIKMLEDLKPDDIGISVSYPLPGTLFYENVKSELLKKQNWTDSDDLDLMFENIYPKEFYRTLHRYVHRKFRKEQGIAALKELFRSGKRSSEGMWRSILLTPFHARMERSEKRKLVNYFHEQN